MEKYLTLRDQIQQGDIILFHGNALISRAIRWLDNAPYNHAGLVFEATGRKFVMESTHGGVNPRFLSVVMKKEKYTNFCIIRPKAWTKEQISAALELVFNDSEEVIDYDHKLILQIAIKRLFNRNIRMDSQRLDICSEFTRRYTRFLKDTIADNYEMPTMPNEFITPWDFVLYARANFDVLFNDFHNPNDSKDDPNYKPNEKSFRDRGMQPA